MLGDQAVRTVRQLERSTHTGVQQAMLRLQFPLPDRYRSATGDQLDAWIGAARRALGDRLFILGHHYQRDEVMKWADARGDCAVRIASVVAQRRET